MIVEEIFSCIVDIWLLAWSRANITVLSLLILDARSSSHIVLDIPANVFAHIVLFLELATSELMAERRRSHIDIAGPNIWPFSNLRAFLIAQNVSLNDVLLGISDRLQLVPIRKHKLLRLFIVLLDDVELLRRLISKQFVNSYLFLGVCLFLLGCLVLKLAF